MLLPLFNDLDVVAPFSLIRVQFGGSGEGLDGVVVVSEGSLGLGERVEVIGVVGSGLDGSLGEFEGLVEAALFKDVTHGQVILGDSECRVGVECAEVISLGLGIVFAKIRDDCEFEEGFCIGARPVGEDRLMRVWMPARNTF